MYHFSNVIQHFNRAAKRYSAEATIQQLHVSKLTHQLSEIISPGSKLIDIGCGPAILAQAVERENIDWQIVGLDMSYHMCMEAQQSMTHCIQGDMHALPFASNNSDAAFCSFTLQWSNDPDRAIAEMARVVKTEGHIALLTFVDGTLKELSEANASLGMHARTNHFHTANNISQWLEKNGLSVEQHSEDEQTSYYASTKQLFSHLKGMGATNSNKDSISGLGHRRQLEQLSQAYQEMFGSSAGLPATWNIGSWICKKVR